MYPQINIGPMHLPAFGSLLVVGFIATILALHRQARLARYPFHRLHAATLLAFAGGSVGARVVYMILVERRFSFSGMLDFSQGTMVYGFIIGAALVSVAYIRWSGQSLRQVLDLCIPAWLPMQICGRIGCLLAGCCYGLPTHLPWGVRYTQPISDAPVGVDLHPTQIYEAIGLTGILFILELLRHRKRFRGQLTLLYLMLYAVLRFLIEFLRDDTRGSFFNGLLSTSQTIALAVLVVAVPLYIIGIRYRRYENHSLSIKVIDGNSITQTSEVSS